MIGVKLLSNKIDKEMGRHLMLLVRECVTLWGLTHSLDN